MATTLQVISFGHLLSNHTHRYLNARIQSHEYYRVFVVPVHVERFDEIPAKVNETFEELLSQGCDLSGRTPTIMVAPGMSVMSMALMAAWAGITGDLPEVFNLMRCGVDHIPSPEMPVIKLQELKNKSRSEFRARALKSHQSPIIGRAFTKGLDLCQEVVGG